MSDDGKRKISVGFFDPVSEKTGGVAYREALCTVLAGRYDLERFRVTGETGMLPSVRLRRMLEIVKVKTGKDVWIRDFYPVVGMTFRRNPGKNIGLFHHMYTEEGNTDFLAKSVEALFLRNIRKCERVVTVSHFWKNYFSELGVQNVRVISNAIEPRDFEFEPAELQTFKQKYSLMDSTVVYIGNCRRQKGVVEVFEALKDCGYTLVTSGEPDVALPCANLVLSYREYLMLLKTAEIVITMSKFREGWCRTAHEAMLCKTPVIGSGAGGMAELLEGGNQYICRDVSELPELVTAAIGRQKIMGEEGYRFASTFTPERFEREWVSLVEEVARDEPRTD